MPYVKVSDLSLIPEGSIKSFNIEGTEIMVININGKINCLQARCTHAGAPLAEGKIEDNILTCPWHGSKFEITTGEVVKGPAEENLKSYKHKISNEELFVEI